MAHDSDPLFPTRAQAIVMAQHWLRDGGPQFSGLRGIGSVFAKFESLEPQEVL